VHFFQKLRKIALLVRNFRKKASARLSAIFANSRQIREFSPKRASITFFEQRPAIGQRAQSFTSFASLGSFGNAKNALFQRLSKSLKGKTLGVGSKSLPSSARLLTVSITI